MMGSGEQQNATELAAKKKQELQLLRERLEKSGEDIKALQVV
jgi:hypothetical protein